MRRLLVALFAVLVCVAVCSFYVGRSHCSVVVATREVTEYVELPPKVIVREVVSTREVPVEVLKEAQVVRWQTTPLRNWQTIAEFKDWYTNQNFPPTPFLDCDDDAARVQFEALKQGYAVAQALVLDGRYYGVRVASAVGGHVGGLVLVGDCYYYFEPNPKEFYVKRIVERD